MGVKVLAGEALLPDGAHAIDCAIPLEGARVRVRSGPRADQEGLTETVSDGRTVMDAMDPELVPIFVKTQRARFGADWLSHWYEAGVLFPDGTSARCLWCDLEVLETDLTRPDGFRVLR